jgi:hypothetical protein
VFCEVLLEWGDEVDGPGAEVTYFLPGDDLAFDQSLFDKQGAFADVPPLKPEHSSGMRKPA